MATTRVGKRSAADFLQASSRSAAAAATTPLPAAKRAKAAVAVIPAASDDLSSLLYPQGRKPTSELTLFQRRVYALTRRIPAGQVSTYKHVAASLGSPTAYRAVGNALRHNPFAPNVPCHRVLASDGSLGGFAGGSGVCALTSKKRSMLQAEGIAFDADGRSLRKETDYRSKVILQRIDSAGLEQDISDEQLSR